MRKKISILAIIAAVVIIVIFAVRGDNKIEAEKRINLEMEYVQSLSDFIEQTDIVTAAYSSAQIDKEAYKERNNVLKNEYFMLQNHFSVWLEKHPVKGETEITQRGENALKNMQKDIETLLDCTFKEDKEPYDIYQLYYRYLEQKNRVKADMTEYLVVHEWLQNKEIPFEQIVEKYSKEADYG